MSLRALQDRQKRQRYFAIFKKRIVQPFRVDCESTPVFVLGKQRSGTSMLMQAFHNHSEMLVFDEHAKSRAFLNHRIRSFQVITGIVQQSKFPIVCFKPICDSHRIGEFSANFPVGHIVWIYRSFYDVVNSTIRKFDSPTRAIRLVCTGQRGGGWFQEGVSPDVLRVLREIYQPNLSEFDFACLVWWARNQIIVESGLIGQANVTILKYEALASRPADVLRWLLSRIGINFQDRMGKHITPRSIRRNSAPRVDVRVERLCGTLMETLDQAYYASGSPHPPS